MRFFYLFHHFFSTRNGSKEPKTVWRFQFCFALLWNGVWELMDLVFSSFSVTLSDFYVFFFTCAEFLFFFTWTVCFFSSLSLGLFLFDSSGLDHVSLIATLFLFRPFIFHWSLNLNASCLIMFSATPLKSLFSTLFWVVVSPHTGKKKNWAGSDGLFGYICFVTIALFFSSAFHLFFLIISLRWGDLLLLYVCHSGFL